MLGFFAEGLVRFNYYETNLNSPSINVYDQKIRRPRHHRERIGRISLGYA
jgi:hypothetical protein